ncbi:MAG: dockerin type I domain-containing protein, partial [bacterium]
GYTMQINVTVENLGSVTETVNSVIYSITRGDNLRNYTVTATDSLPIFITAREAADVALQWNTTGVAKGNYTVTAYAAPVPGETDTTDNTFTDGWVIVAMVGDVTGPDGWPDGKVDIRDIAIIARIFGVIAPDPRYNPNYDIIYDGKIDIRDIATVAKEFGKIDP